MTGHDPEIEELRHRVHCAVVLERTPPPWKLDRKESTKLSLKYRRDKGEILIVSHAGRERLGNYYYPVTEYVPEIRDIQVAIRTAPNIPAIVSIPDQQPLPTRAEGPYTTFTAPPLHALASFCVPGYFATQSSLVRT